MKKIWLLIALFACEAPMRESGQDAIMRTDREFSAMSAEKGVAAAFVAYADDEVVKPSEGSQPIFGKDALAASYNGRKLNFRLTWEPLKAEASGDLGYTFGNWTLKSTTTTGRDTTTYGNYVSIWKRQPDGSWKYVLDTGNGTPAPTELPVKN
ncbi:MAG: DUF4440 domain-containing protein [Cyclobacteriaceae bacterium]|nr:DUF4440 domain-containing protein [Cyclobacteriaceae bacterium]